VIKYGAYRISSLFQQMAAVSKALAEMLLQ